MTRVTIEPFSPSGSTFIAANLRQSDLDEMHAVFGPNVPVQETAYTIAARSVPWSYTAKLDSQPAMAFGVYVDQHVPHLGVAWGFGTDRTRRVIPVVSKFIKRELMPTLLSNGLNRVEVRVLGTKAALPSYWWLMSMGAEPEAELKACGFRGETFAQLSWTRNDQNVPNNVHAEATEAYTVGPGPL